MSATMTDATNAVNKLRGFIGTSQLQAIGNACRGEERQWFKDKLVELAQAIETMPKTYEQDGLGNQAVAHLHYFVGSCDWYITEKDSDPDGEGQIQAFGSADLGYGVELGYISIQEITRHDAELDLYFTPSTLAALAKAS